MMEERPLYTVTLWPYRSLGRRGFGWTIYVLGAPLALLSLLVAFRGAWYLAPLIMSPIALIALAIMRNNRDGNLHETLTIWKGRFCLRRTEVDGKVREAKGDTYFANIIMLKDKGPVENYLIFKTPKKQLELGRFLSPEERAALYEEIRAILPHAR